MVWTLECSYDKQAAVNNVNALRQEIADAVANHRRAIVPAGVYRLDCYNLPGGVAIEINDDVTIKGAGRSVTVLRVGPDLLTTATTLFYIHPGKKVQFEDLTIEGPPYLAGSKPDGSDATDCTGIYHEGGGELKLKNVTLHAWHHCIKADELPKTTPGNKQGSQLSFTDCLIGGRSVGLLQFEGDSLHPASLAMENCLFAHDANAYIGHHHNLYIAEGVDMTFRHCHWTRSVDYGVTMYGGRARAPIHQPLFEYCTFDGAVFRALQTNKRTKTIIRNCIFRNPQAGALQITLS
ncbi:MAG: right-handed parallel beta-helix repeat-containing protein, partial [Caldilineaceae bacterium]|nr:right-handed parallel beta-helix repeat-containing protein [Caldilineaceae bacterium]